VKKLLAAFFGLLGLAWWRKRAEQPREDTADALRAKLAEQRPQEPPPAEPEPEPEPEAEPEPEPQADVETRRHDVHDRARAAIDDLASPDD